MTKIELTTEEAKLFIEFQKRYAFIKAMDNLHIFDLKDGSVEIHFDSLGAIGLIKTHQNFRPI
jgi:hypothetical protein